MPRRREVFNSDNRVTCPQCEGAGQVMSTDVDGEWRVCPACSGEGRVSPSAAESASAN